MSGFGGIIRLDACPAEEGELVRLGRALRIPGEAPPVVWHEGAAGLCHRLFAYTAEDRLDRQPLLGRGRKLAFAFSGRLDNRDELADALGIGKSDLRQTGDAALTMAAWERWGIDALPRVFGDFALACWDIEKQRLVLARDAMGAVPLFYHISARRIAFATDYPGLLALADVPRDLDEVALADFLVLNHRDAQQTLYAAILRVPSGSCAIVENGNLRVIEYWNPAIADPGRRVDAQEAIETARVLLDRAVAERLRSLTPVAAEISGGLDSSAVAATAARLIAPDRLPAFTLVPPAGAEVVPLSGHYPDERDKVVAIDRFIENLDVTLLAPDAPHRNETDPNRMFAATGVPVRNPMNYGWFAHLRDHAAAGGHRVLLTGVDGNFTLSWAGSLALVEHLKARRFGALASEISALHRAGVPLWRVFYFYIGQFLEPTGLRRWHRVTRQGQRFGWEAYSLVNSDFAAEVDLLGRAYAMHHDPTIRLPPDGGLARARMVVRHNEQARDFAAFSPALHGVQLRHPLTDRRLVEFTLALPETLFLRQGTRRWFARQVLADRLPPEVLEEMRPGTQSSDWYQRMTARRDELVTETDRLFASATAARVVDLPRLHQLATTWPRTAAPETRPRIIDAVALDRALHVGRFIRWVEGGNR